MKMYAIAPLNWFEFDDGRNRGFQARGYCYLVYLDSEDTWSAIFSWKNKPDCKDFKT